MDTQTQLGNGHVSMSQALLDWTDAQRKVGHTPVQIVSQLHRVAELIGREVKDDSGVDTLYDVTIEGGKYRFVYLPGGGHEAYRYGERWPAREESMTGDKALFCLVAKVAELEELLDMSARVVGTMIAVDTATPPVGSAALTARVDVEGEGMKIVAQVLVDWDKITNCFVGALEGGYSQWLHAFRPTNEPISIKLADAARGGENTVWYNDPAFWVGGGTADVQFDSADDEEGEGTGRMTVGRSDVQRGLNLMAEKAPKHFADLVNEEDDAITHDVFVQMMILGDIVYG